MADKDLNISLGVSGAEVVKNTLETLKKNTNELKEAARKLAEETKLGSEIIAISKRTEAEAARKLAEATRKVSIENKNTATSLKDLLGVLKASEIDYRRNIITKEQFGQKADIVRAKISKLSLTIPQLAQAQSALYHSTQRVGVGFKGMATAMDAQLQTSRQSRAALLSVAQAAQDAPYGIRGLSNNIDFLVQQFIALRVTAGGTTAAFKAMWVAMKGASGFLILFSIISAAINYFTNLKESADDAFDSLLKFDELKLEFGLNTQTEAIKNFVKEFEKYKKSLGEPSWWERLTNDISQVVSHLGAAGFVQGATIKPKIKPTSQEELEAQKELHNAVLNTFKVKEESIKLDKGILELKKEDYVSLRKSVLEEKKKTDDKLLQKKLQLLYLEYGKKIDELDEKSATKSTKIAKEKQDSIKKQIDLLYLQNELGIESVDTAEELEVKVKEQIALLKDENAIAEANVKLNETIKDIKDGIEKQDKNKINSFESELELAYEKLEITKEEYAVFLETVRAEYERKGLLEDAARIIRLIKKLEKKDDGGFSLFEEIGKTALREINQQFNGIINKIDITQEKLGLAGVKFRDFANAVVNALAQVLAKMAAMAALSVILTPLVGGGGALSEMLGGATDFGSLFGYLFSGKSAGKARGGYINEPITGIGASGRMYQFGERGSELIIPNNRLANNMIRGGMASSQPININVVGKIKGKDIYLSNLRHTNKLSRLSY